MTDQLAIYCRVSSQTQKDDGTSLDVQRQNGLRKSEELGLTPILFDEGAASSHSEELSHRPKLLSLLREIDNGSIKHIYVYNTDRLSRNDGVWTLIRAQLLKNKVKLYTNSGEYSLEDPMSSMVLTIMSSVAVYDNAIRMERFRSGKFERLKNNPSHWMGGPPPFGYYIDKKKLVENKKESKWVNEIFTMFVDGKSFEQIRMRLMENGVLSRRGNPIFSVASLRNILTNPHYSGYYTFTDSKTEETLTLSCPPIVPQPLIDRAAELLDKRSNGERKERQTKETYLLSGLLYCSHCGSRYTVYKTNTNRQQPYYYCTQKTNYHKNKTAKCTAKRNLNLYQTDRILFEMILNVITNSNLFRESIKTEVLGDRNDVISGVQKKKYNSRLKKLGSEIEKIDVSIITLKSNDLIDDEDSTNELVIGKLNDKKSQLQNEIDEINQLLIRSKNKTQWIDWVGHFEQKMESLKSEECLVDEKKEFLQKVIDRINVEVVDSHNHNIEIVFKLPYVDDQLIWIDPSKKSKGYEVKDGKKSLVSLINFTKNHTETKELE